MDTRQALLDARVAEAAEAWLTDPQDVGVYARLVAAVDERRRGRVTDHVAPPHEAAVADRVAPRDAEEAPLPDAEHEPGTVLSISREPTSTLTPTSTPTPALAPDPAPVGADLAGDPTEVLRRLRGG